MALCVDIAPMNDNWNNDSQNKDEIRPLDSGERKLVHVKMNTAKNRAVKANCRMSSACLSPERPVLERFRCGFDRG